MQGSLATALGMDEELAIYDGTTLAAKKLGVATVSSDNSWTFTPTKPLTNGPHTLKAVIQAVDVTDIANGRVISAANTNHY